MRGFSQPPLTRAVEPCRVPQEDVPLGKGPASEEAGYIRYNRAMVRFRRIENPVEAALVSEPEDWKWSSYRFYAKNGPVAVVPDTVDLPADKNALLWPAPWR